MNAYRRIRRDASGARSRGPERRWLAPGEVARLFATPCRRPEVGRAFLFSCLTGLRLSDILALRHEQVRSINGRLWLDFVSKKGRKRQLIPLGRIATDILASSPGGEARVPGRVFGALPSVTTIRRNLKRWCAEAGIGPDVCFHSARHTFASSLVCAGADLYTVGELLGHSRLHTTLVYARVPDRRMYAELDKLDRLHECHGTT